MAMAQPKRSETTGRQSASPISRRLLPTRVSKACRRCRRNKSRCDSFRPCSLCLRAGVDCDAAENDKLTSAALRTPGRQHVVDSQRQSYPRSADNDHALPKSRARQPSISSHRSSNENIEIQPQNAEPQVQLDPSGSWTPVDYGEPESAMGIARKICRLGSQNIDDSSTTAIPDGASGTRTPQTAHGDERVPISVILQSRFPSPQLIDSLLEDYFDAVHWFSLVVYEPRFRQRLSSVADGYAYPSEESFLTLLSMILCMASWYRSERGFQDDGKEWSSDLLHVVESRLVQLMDQRSTTAVQTCILLGSHHVYHGKPNLSFALLGASIKIAQAMGFHRKLHAGDFNAYEERKRVWWTIYTWDRFASISYGRPLSINDEDCTVEMPADFPEFPYFVQQTVPQAPTGIVYSPYQRELSRMYLIASPALKTIFGCLASPDSHHRFGSHFTVLVNDVTQKLTAWHQQLPPNLTLDLGQDYQPEHSDWSTRAHLLQSLSLQLTFDSLMIVLYRPFLSRQVEHLSMNVSRVNEADISGSRARFQAASPHSQASNILAHDPLSPMSEATASSEYWWSAAVRTAHVTELPQLAQLATNSHLVAFMAMNLFNAAIVLISLALSDPLSDRAQGVKRSMTRILRLQELLGQRSALSRQSSTVLKNLIYLLLRREVEAILTPIATVPTQVGSGAEQPHVAPQSPGNMSVGETLRLPVQAALSMSDQIAPGQSWSTMSRMQRLNESLASVQRVFLPFQDQSFQPHTTDANNREVELDRTVGCFQPNTWLAPSNQIHDCLETQAPSHDREGNDLFWLWDVTWDASYGQ